MEYNRHQLETVASTLAVSKKRRERKLSEDLNKFMYLNAYNLLPEQELREIHKQIMGDLYHVFEKRLDSSSVMAISHTDCSITDLSNDVYTGSRGKWFITKTRVQRKNIEDPERRGEVLYEIPRTSEGYVVTPELGLTEEQAAEAFTFLDQCGSSLNAIHEWATQREEALQHYGLKHDNEYNRELCEEILTFLGHREPAQKVAQI